MGQAAHSISCWNTISTFVIYIDDYSVVVDNKVISVANWSIIRPQDSKGAEQNNERPDKSSIELGHIFPERGKKGPNISTVLLPLFPM